MLELTQKTLNIAKSVKEKNALAITLSKRSGSERTIKGQWGRLDKFLEELIDLHHKELIPDGAAYELEELILKFKTDDKELIGDLQKAALNETKRVLRRKRALRGKEPMQEDTIKRLEDFLNDDGFSLDKVQLLVDILIIAAEFAAVMDLAKGVNKNVREV